MAASATGAAVVDVELGTKSVPPPHADDTNSNDTTNRLMVARLPIRAWTLLSRPAEPVEDALGWWAGAVGGGEADPLGVRVIGVIHEEMANGRFSVPYDRPYQIHDPVSTLRQDRYTAWIASHRRSHVPLPRVRKRPELGAETVPPFDPFKVAHQRADRLSTSRSEVYVEIDRDLFDVQVLELYRYCGQPHSLRATVGALHFRPGCQAERRRRSDRHAGWDTVDRHRRIRDFLAVLAIPGPMRPSLNVEPSEAAGNRIFMGREPATC